MKSHGDLRKVVVTYTSVENHLFELVWKKGKE